MTAESLADAVSSLTVEQQEAVRQFVAFLKLGSAATPTPFLAAVDEFIAQHPELLRRLAQ